MRVIMRNGWLGLLVMACLLGGCDGASDPTLPATRTGEPIVVHREFKGQQAPVAGRGFVVVQQPETWLALWGDQSAPAIDFRTQTVLVALMGERPTEGYTITLGDVRRTNDQVIVYIEETEPARNAIVAQVRTRPYHMVVVPRITQPVCINMEPACPPLVAMTASVVGQVCGGVPARTVVIRDDAGWRSLWTETLQQPPPSMTFTDTMAVAVILGGRSTARTVAITHVEVVDDRLVVRYRVRPERSSATSTTAMSPYAIAIIPASPLPVTFQEIVPPPPATQSKGPEMPPGAPQPVAP